ncbi:protein kinase [Isosphaeraceae bacterium EP7]
MTEDFQQAGGPRPAAGAEVPRRLAHYEVLRPLGRGGMSEVFLARDTRLGREVAIKMLPEAFAGDQRALERLRREARTASALNHPHIGTIHELGEDGGRPFVVMERVEGRTFDEVIAEGPNPDAAARLGRQVAEALAAAHAAGLVHRDIKPSNLMVRGDGYAKVLDFGLARSAGPAVEDSFADDAGPTAKGRLVGTPRYMAPEQALGEPTTTAADVFSLGLVLYELAAGRPPFPVDSIAASLRAVISEPIPPPSRFNPAIPAPLEALILRMLWRDHRLRPSAAEVAGALGAVTPHRFDRRLIGREEELDELLGTRRLIGREQELGELLGALRGAESGRGRIIGVAGEAGIGKTALVESFLARVLAGPGAPLVARGGCSERLAGAEAYLPIQEALGSLLREPDRGRTIDILRRVATTWSIQVVPLSVDDSGYARLANEAHASSQERLKREFVALVRELSRARPLVLFLDDVHWADVSTVDLLFYLGGRIGSLPLLVLATYRPSDLALAGHPFVSVKQELQSKGDFHELGLPFLGRAAIELYLAEAFPEHRLPADFVDLIHAKTEGNPLFLVGLVRDLRERGVIAQDGGRWSLVGSVTELARVLPESLTGLIRRKVDRLDEPERRLLVAASVQGAEFDAAVVARALGLDAIDVEERLEALEHAHGLVRELAEREFPDRTLTLHYGFVHVLYQNALYATLKPTRRVALSRAVAEALLGFHGERSQDVAAELALLLEAARDFARAADYFLLAAQNAVRVSANQEAVVLARRGLEMLPMSPDSPRRAHQELSLQITLGTPLKAIKGWMAPEVERAYRRALKLCGQVGETPDLGPALWGLWHFHIGRGEIPIARNLGEQLLSLGRRVHDPSLILQAHHALGPTDLVAGDWASAMTHLDLSVSLYDPQRHRAHAFLYGGHDPCVCCQSLAAWCLWMLGYPDQALRSSREALALAQTLSHPTSLAHARQQVGIFHQFCRDLPETWEQAEACQRLAAEQGIPFYAATASVLRGWALAERGQVEEGLALIRQGLAGSAMSPLFWRVYFRALLAEVCGKAGKVEEGMATLDEAQRAADDKGIGFYEPELHRLRGVLLLDRGPESSSDAEACFRQATAIARRQGAKSLELRAVMSLSRLLRDQGKQDEARPMLAEIFGWFTEGFDTADLREAKDLLQAVS